MDPHRQPQAPLFPHSHNFDLDFNVAEQQTTADPNVWGTTFAANSTSLPPSLTTAAVDSHAEWATNSLPLAPHYLEEEVSRAAQQQQQQILYPHPHQHPHPQPRPHQHQHQHQHHYQHHHHHHHPLQHQQPRHHPQQPPQQNHQFYSPHYTTPSPAAYHSPLSESHLLTHTTSSPYTYNASPNSYSIPSPFERSMSVSTLSNVDSVSSQPQQPQQNTNTFLPTPKQIRFVSSDGQPHTKRRRINAACLTCRKRKTRCSGEKPECRTCTDNGHVCAGYAERPARNQNERKSDDGNDDEDEDGSGSLSPKKFSSDQGPAPPRSSLQSQTSVNYERQSSYNNGSRQRQMQDTSFDERSPVSSHTANTMGTMGSSANVAGRTRVPYFRYFGPTAIAPGFKQMVVQVKDTREHHQSQASASADSPSIGGQGDNGAGPGPEATVAPVDLPYYDATDSEPVPALITHLCETFFDKLGCNYPFLQEQRFLSDLADKRVDAILVNSVCAMAARFSSDPALEKSDLSLPLDSSGEVKRAFRGQPFAQRAMAAVIDTFPCPTLAVTQACLLLAYEEFGSDKDSGLWMYLGTSIRMAQDLGIQKLEGMQLEGRLGPTPKTAKNGHQGKQEELRRAEHQKRLTFSIEGKDGLVEDRRASEQERIDTFWSIFFLDRAVSSGVGRPVTLRDKDIEISFPYRPNEKVIHGYPHPFPVMIRIVHMYGRVADVLNNIKEVTQVTEDVLKRLAGMEKDLTGIYQRLSPKLHFNATNFQHYVKYGQGTNFILLHFWFHTLIVLVHQPTLLHSFEGSIQQLFPDSRELSMSSAKTIADILAFAELIDVKSFIGNPFTSQPIYVAACAFLTEAAAHASQPPSRDHSPVDKISRRGAEMSLAAKEAEQNLAAKHSLLATAANQNYQRCLKALKLLDTYWGGCRYIITALEQRSKGLTDPLLFTSDDVDGEMPSTELSFTTPGWRRSSYGVSLGGSMRAIRNSSQDIAWSPKMDWSHAIGWSLTGTANSPAPNLSFLYQNPTNENETVVSPNMKRVVQTAPVRPAAVHPDPPQPVVTDYASMQSPTYNSQSSMLPPQRARMSGLPYDPVATADGELLLGLHSPYSVGSSGTPTMASNPQQTTTPTFEYSRSHAPSMRPPISSGYFASPNVNYGDMLIEAQEVDMSDQHNFNHTFGFPGGEMIPWLEYLPQDVLNYFGDAPDMGMGMHGSQPAAGMVMPSGPGPPDTGQNRNHTPG